MDYLDAVKVLQGIPIFASLEPSKLKLLAFASEYLTFEDGEALFHVGDPADCVYLIEDGKAGAYGEKDGREVLVAELGRHQVFGEMAIFRNTTRIATIRAHGKLDVVRIDGNMFLELVTHNPEAALGVMRELSEKIARAMEDYEEMEGRVRTLQSVSDIAGGVDEPS